MTCFSRRSGSSLIAAALWAGFARGSGAQGASATIEVAPGVFVLPGAHALPDAANLGLVANLGFVIGQKAVAVVDTGGSRAAGRKLRAAVRGRTDLPVRYVVNTHVHPDHTLGNAAFSSDDPVFVGHAKLPAALAERGPFYLERLAAEVGEAAAAGTEIRPPTTTVEDTATLDLGGRVLRLQAHPPAHTDTDLTVLDAASGTLLTGDLVFLERTPVLDGSLVGWLEAMGRLGAIPAARAVPGHGPASAPWPVALQPQEAYLEGLAAEVRAMIAEGGTLQEAVAAADAARNGAWRLFAATHPRNVTAAFAELEWE